MEGTVSASAIGWAAVATGILALVALILLWRKDSELRKVRWDAELLRVGWHLANAGWRTPISPSDASQSHRGPDGEILADTATTPPDAAGVGSGAVTTTSGEEGKLQPTEVARIDLAQEPHPLDLLLELLEDDEPYTRRHAVTALAGIRAPLGAERLTLVLAQDPSAEVRREAVTALRDSLERPGAGSDTAAT